MNQNVKELVFSQLVARGFTFRTAMLDAEKAAQFFSAQEAPTIEEILETLYGKFQVFENAEERGCRPEHEFAMFAVAVKKKYNISVVNTVYNIVRNDVRALDREVNKINWINALRVRISCTLRSAVEFWNKHYDCG